MESCLNTKIPIQAFSINKAFQGRRFKTKDCLLYEKVLRIFLPNLNKIKGWVEVSYEFGLPAKSFAITDVGNLEKILSDILVKKGYFEDDRKIIDLHLKKVKSDKPYIAIKVCPV